MRIRRTQKNNRGFTLIEVIVVLIVLAVLIALLVPALTGYIDKSNRKKVIAECRQCVEAAQTVQSEHYGKDNNYQITIDEDGSAILKLAEVGDESNASDSFFGEFEISDKGKLMHLYYTDGKYKVTYCADADGCGLHNETYTVEGEEAGLSFGDTKVISQIMSALKKQRNTLSSQGATYSPNNYAANAVKELATLGIDLEKMGATSWLYQNDSLYWTEQDISTGYNPGDMITVMKYNTTANKYYVAKVKLDTKSVRNNATGKYVSYLDMTTATGTVRDSYEDMVAAYKEAQQNDSRE